MGVGERLHGQLLCWQLGCNQDLNGTRVKVFEKIQVRESGVYPSRLWPLVMLTFPCASSFQFYHQLPTDCKLFRGGTVCVWVQYLAQWLIPEIIFFVPEDFHTPSSPMPTEQERLVLWLKCMEISVQFPALLQTPVWSGVCDMGLDFSCTQHPCTQHPRLRLDSQKISAPNKCGSPEFPSSAAGGDSISGRICSFTTLLIPKLNYGNDDAQQTDVCSRCLKACKVKKAPLLTKWATEQFPVPLKHKHILYRVLQCGPP